MLQHAIKNGLCLSPVRASFRPISFLKEDFRHFLIAIDFFAYFFYPKKKVRPRWQANKNLKKIFKTSSP